ncbi:radical SAM protein [Candidatus Poribacteria bacterium]|nr:radical SAM protein [Candidatus Poribacteria bacterium]
MPNALLIYPEFPPSYWGANFALEFIGKKSSMPPLGLLTVAALFPDHYDLRVIDMNVDSLSEIDLDWADYAFTSTMIVQKDSLAEVIQQCRQNGVKVIAGGPHPTSFYTEIEGVDHFILDEVEDFFLDFLLDLENGQAQRIYRAMGKPDVTKTLPPRYDLINLEAYGSMALQFSRGCPFDCEFCDITKLFGRVPRTKTDTQMIDELSLLYRLGWRGPIFLVDDNFIGNKRDATRLLPTVAEWQKARGFPFRFYTESSVNLAELEPLMEAMVEAGFNMTFLGIETPNPEVLLKTKKKQNTKSDTDNYLLSAVEKIQSKGMEVTAGFILGLDGDTKGVFDSQIQFVQDAGIPTAMIGLLTALKGTDLYHRLQREGRLLEESTGNNVSITLNFETEMDRQTLVNGYKRVLSTLYDPTLKNYFNRCLKLFKRYPDRGRTLNGYRWGKIGKVELKAVLGSLRQQLFSKQGLAYLRFILKVLKDYPSLFPEAIRLAIMGYHFEKTTSQQIAIDDFKNSLETELGGFRYWLERLAYSGSDRLQTVGSQIRQLLT